MLSLLLLVVVVVLSAGRLVEEFWLVGVVPDVAMVGWIHSLLLLFLLPRILESYFVDASIVVGYGWIPLPKEDLSARLELLY